MAKQKDMEARLQSERDNLKEAMNSVSGFKATMSSGTVGSGASLNNHKK